MSAQRDQSADSLVPILIVDDDVKLCRLIREYLEPLGYALTAVHTGPEGLEVAAREQFSAVILDVMLPGMNGFDVLRNLRTKSNVPVLMLTGRGEEADRIVGLELGADDYLPKTFSTRELLARLRAVLRRSIINEAAAADKRSAPVIVGDLYIDPEAHTAMLEDQQMILTRQE